MSEMFERVFRAIAKAGGNNPDRLPKEPGPGYPMRQMYEAMTRAAIEAMREPTDEMANAGYHGTSYWEDSHPTAVWQAMIDAALAEPKS